jgi:hypothetical protein
MHCLQKIQARIPFFLDSYYSYQHSYTLCCGVSNLGFMIYKIKMTTSTILIQSISNIWIYEKKKNHFPIDSYVKPMSCDGDHLGFPINTKIQILKETIQKLFMYILGSIKLMVSQKYYFHFPIWSYVKTLWWRPSGFYDWHKKIHIFCKGPSKAHFSNFLSNGSMGSEE